MIHWTKHTLPVDVLIDSGADDSFIDIGLVREHNLPVYRLNQPKKVLAIGGQPIDSVTHKTQPIKLTLSGNHHEQAELFVISSPLTPIVLGLPWLRTHNPHIDWVTTSIRNWSDHCHRHCLFSAIPKTSPDLPAPPEDIDLANVPCEYHELKEAFSKDQALTLPPHRPYDCAIDLLPGSPLPTQRLYNISKPEKETMETYINTSVAAGLIRPSSSPVGAGFFFVEKKDKTLRPCIDYTGLNAITVKNKYPLPLLDSAFTPLHDSVIFTKLDLRNAYHLVRIKEGDEWKTAFNTHLGHFEYLVMPFGLTNAPAVFQALVNDMLRDMLNRFVFVYLDDILIFFSQLCRTRGPCKTGAEKTAREQVVHQGRKVRLSCHLH